jgi:hypothetical protein
LYILALGFGVVGGRADPGLEDTFLETPTHACLPRMTVADPIGLIVVGGAGAGLGAGTGSLTDTHAAIGAFATLTQGAVIGVLLRAACSRHFDEITTIPLVAIAVAIMFYLFETTNGFSLIIQKSFFIGGFLPSSNHSNCTPSVVEYTPIIIYLPRCTKEWQLGHKLAILLE